MIATTNPLPVQFQMQTGFFTKALHGIAEEDRHGSTSSDTNHLAWLTGHIVSCRYLLANMLGITSREPHPELFAHLKGIDRGADYPSLAVLQQPWQRISEQLLDRLALLSDDDLAAKAPMGDGALLDIITFFAYHEAYHIGQIGLLRKHLGYEPINHFE